MKDHRIDYLKLLSEIAGGNTETKIEFLSEELPHQFHKNTS